MRELGAPAGRGARPRRVAARRGARSPRCAARSRSCARRGWQLGVLSNTDDDFIAASQVQHRRVVRRGRRRTGDRLLQAGAPALGGVLRAHARAARRPRARRGLAVPRHRAVRASSACGASGSTGTARRADGVEPTRELADLLALPRRSMSSSPLRELREDDADAVAALFVEAFGDARPLDAEEIRTWFRNDGAAAGVAARARARRARRRLRRHLGRRTVRSRSTSRRRAAGTRSSTGPRTQARAASAGTVGRISRPGTSSSGSSPPAATSRAARSFTMEIALDRAARGAPPPDGIELRPYRRRRRRCAVADQRRLRRHPRPPRGDAMRSSASSISARAASTRRCGRSPGRGDEPAGFVARLLRRRRRARLGGSGRSACARRGVGAVSAALLLRFAFAELYARGLRRVGLGVDAENADRRGRALRARGHARRATVRQLDAAAR